MKVDDGITIMDAVAWNKEYDASIHNHAWQRSAIICPKCGANMSVSNHSKWMQVGQLRPVACWDAKCGAVGAYEVKG